SLHFFFFFQAEVGIRYFHVTGVQTCALPIFTVYGAVSSRKLPAMVWEGDRFRTDAAAYLRRSYALSLGLFAAVLACMVLMRFGRWEERRVGGGAGAASAPAARSHDGLQQQRT